MDRKTKFLLTAATILVGLGLLLIFQVQQLGKLRLIFCDVGQGDGILIISPGGGQVLVDGGPGSRIIDCLGQKMPFWDRTVELVVLTHPQRDHLEGLVEVLARYQVKTIMTTGVANETAVFAAWEEAVKNEGAKVYTPSAGDRLLIDSGEGPSLTGGRPLELRVLAPSREQIDLWSIKAPKDLNETSIVVRLDYGDPSAGSGQGFCAYLTGDIPKETFADLALQGVALQSCQVLKVSHHGSKTGTSQEMLDLIDPEVAVIQVGKNSFGHPHKEVLEILQSRGVKILRNDINGIIEVESDGVAQRVWKER